MKRRDECDATNHGPYSHAGVRQVISPSALPDASPGRALQQFGVNKLMAARKAIDPSEQQLGSPRDWAVRQGAALRERKRSAVHSALRK